MADGGIEIANAPNRVNSKYEKWLAAWRPFALLPKADWNRVHQATEWSGRKLIGATDPSQAAEGTIRKRFAESKAKNAVHGSDSDENAAIEGEYFFSGRERF